MLDSAGDVRGIFAKVITGLEELRRDMTGRIDPVDEKLSDELADAKSLAKCDQVQLVQNTDQCLAESLALVTKESEERVRRMT